MADTKIQRIVDQVIARLQLINSDDDDYETNGFVTSVGERVEDGRQNWNENELPAISVFEGTDTLPEQNDNQKQYVHLLPVYIKVFLIKGVDSKDVRKAISDVKRAIRMDDRWKVEGIGLAMLTREKDSGPEYSEANSFEVTGAQVQIEIQYIAEKFNCEG